MSSVRCRHHFSARRTIPPPSRPTSPFLLVNYRYNDSFHRRSYLGQCERLRGFKFIHHTDGREVIGNLQRPTERNNKMDGIRRVPLCRSVLLWYERIRPTQFRLPSASTYDERPAHRFPNRPEFSLPIFDYFLYIFCLSLIQKSTFSNQLIDNPISR